MKTPRRVGNSNQVWTSTSGFYSHPNITEEYIGEKNKLIKSLRKQVRELKKQTNWWYVEYWKEWKKGEREARTYKDHSAFLTSIIVVLLILNVLQVVL